MSIFKKTGKSVFSSDVDPDPDPPGSAFNRFPGSGSALNADPDPEVPKFTEMVKRKERRETVLSFKVAQRSPPHQAER